MIAAARVTINKHGLEQALPGQFDSLLSGFEDALSSGSAPHPALGSAFEQEADQVSKWRATARQLVAGPAPHNVFATMKMLSTVSRQ